VAVSQCTKITIVTCKQKPVTQRGDQAKESALTDGMMKPAYKSNSRELMSLDVPLGGRTNPSSSGEVKVHPGSFSVRVQKPSSFRLLPE
jgi:hypothetical protein